MPTLKKTENKKTTQTKQKSVKKTPGKKKKIEKELKLLDTDFTFIDFGKKSREGGRFV